MMKKHDSSEKQNYLPMVISYLALRRAVGILGVAFPILMAIGYWITGGEGIRGSISSYYHTGMRDLFVGVLCAVALFLFSYTGYEKKDNITGDLAAVFALGVAFFPTSAGLVGTIHLISAMLFFLLLAFYSLFLFTKAGSNPTKQKLKRNRLYRICGYGIIGSILIMLLYSLLPSFYDVIRAYKPTFWLETIALWAFGVSWLTKGNVLMKDAEEN